MSRLRLVPVLLCVLLPLQGWAQASSPPPLVPAPSEPKEAPSESEEGDPYGGYDDEPEEEPRGELIPRDWRISEWVGPQVPRIIVESLGGLTLGVVGGLPGVVLVAGAAACDTCDDSSSAFLALGVAFVGISGGIGLGVYAGGSLIGGEGRFGVTLVGTLLGVLAGGLVAIPAAILVEGGWVVPLLSFPITGAIIAYEMSHAEALKGKAAPAGDGVKVVPVVSVRPSGGLFAGLAGRF
jgi:hypothetical protein